MFRILSINFVKVKNYNHSTILMQRSTISGNLRASLGFSSPKPAILSSLMVALISFFYVYTISNFINLQLYPFYDRVTIYTFFDAYVISKFIDHLVIGFSFIAWLGLSIRSRLKISVVMILTSFLIIVAILKVETSLETFSLFSLPAIFSLLFYNKKKSKIIEPPNLAVNYLALIGIAFSIIAIIEVMLRLASSPISFRNYIYEIFVVVSTFSPVLILILISSFPAKSLIDPIRSKIKDSTVVSLNKQVQIKWKVTFLLISIILSVFIVLIPHTSTINKDNQQVGVDTGYYVNWVQALAKASPDKLLHEAFVVQSEGDRPLSIILLYAIVTITNTANLAETIEFVPLFLGPSLVVTVYFFTRQLKLGDVASLLSAFLTAISFHTLIGIYAGFYANWIALIFGYSSFIFLLRFLQHSRKRDLAFFSTLIMLTMFFHIYTWTVLTISLGIFLAVILWLKYYNKKNVLILLLVLLSTVAVDVSRVALTNASGGIERDLQIAQEQAGLDQFAKRWSNLSYTMNTYLGGQFGNALIFFLGIFWLVRANLREQSSVFLLSILSIGILPFLFGNWVVQSRVFYDIPFQIPAAIALANLSKQRIGTVIVICLCLWLLAASLRAVSNFHLSAHV